MNAKRGYVPEDDRNFSPAALETLRTASRHISYLIADAGERYSVALDIRVQKDVDRELYGKENVISSDSIILDRCRSWINVMARCLEKHRVQPLKVW